MPSTIVRHPISFTHASNYNNRLGCLDPRSPLLSILCTATSLNVSSSRVWRECGSVNARFLMGIQWPKPSRRASSPQVVLLPSSKFLRYARAHFNIHFADIGFPCLQTLPQEVLTKMYAPEKPKYPIATAAALPEYDGFLIGCVQGRSVCPASDS